MQIGFKRNVIKNDFYIIFRVTIEIFLKNTPVYVIKKNE